MKTAQSSNITQIVDKIMQKFLYLLGKDRLLLSTQQPLSSALDKVNIGDVQLQQRSLEHIR